MMALPPDVGADMSPIQEETWNPRAADCESEIVRQILEYWQYKCRGRKMPARADLDPLEMRGALNQMVMIEIHRDPLRFRTRLVGSQQMNRRGFDFSAQWLDELPAGYRSVVLPRAEAVARRGESVRSRVRKEMDGRLFDYETVWLPLGPDGETASMIMVVQEFFS